MDANKPDSLPPVSSPWDLPTGCVRLLKATPKPVYGWNPLRWLFRRPLRWEIGYLFEMLPGSTAAST